MNYKSTIFFGTIALVMALSSCSKQEYEPYNTPFFRIHIDNKDSITVKYNRKDVVDYKVYLSSELQFEAIQVQFEIIVGNGLKEGEDFIVQNPARYLAFVPGMYERPITIAWLEKPVDPLKDNTVTIRLTGNSKNFALGLPGPDKRQQQLVITKIN